MKEIKATIDNVIENNILYSDNNGLKIKYIQNNDGRKMNIIIDNCNFINDLPANTSDIVFEETVKLPLFWKIIETGSCLNIYDNNDEWIARYPKPIFYDSNPDISDNNETRISGNYNFSKKGNDFIISIDVPVNWLKNTNRKFPVIIDPTISIYPANYTFYTGTISYLVSPANFTKTDDS